MCHIVCDWCLRFITDDDYEWFMHPDNPYRIITLCDVTCRAAWENEEETDR